jgi:hypothetical protein
MVICSSTPVPASILPTGCIIYDLGEYISHKIGISADEIKAGSAERFAIVEAEALRDIIVTSEVAGTDAAVTLLPSTLQNPECGRLVRSHCTFYKPDNCI